MDYFYDGHWKTITGEQVEQMKQALQLFTQAIGDEDGYIPSLGAIKTKQALDLMKEAGIQPVFHNDHLNKYDKCQPTLHMQGVELRTRFIGELELAGFNPYMFNEGRMDDDDYEELYEWQCLAMGMTKAEFDARAK